jgi:hypothetical protein
MRFFLKTQVLAILFAVLWVVYLNILAFLDQPERALQYINWFVYGFAVLFGVIYFLLTKYFLDSQRLSAPLVLIPFLFLYQPLAQKALLSLVSGGYEGIIHFLSRATSTVHLFAILIGVVFGAMFSRRQEEKSSI